MLFITEIFNMIYHWENDWRKEYVKFNTKKRQESTNEFEKKFFKLMIIVIMVKV